MIVEEDGEKPNESESTKETKTCNTYVVSAKAPGILASPFSNQKDDYENCGCALTSSDEMLADKLYKHVSGFENGGDKFASILRMIGRGLLRLSCEERCTKAPMRCHCRHIENMSKDERAINKWLDGYNRYATKHNVNPNGVNVEGASDRKSDINGKSIATNEMCKLSMSSNINENVNGDGLHMRWESCGDPWKEDVSVEHIVKEHMLEYTDEHVYGNVGVQTVPYQTGDSVLCLNVDETFNNEYHYEKHNKITDNVLDYVYISKNVGVVTCGTTNVDLIKGKRTNTYYDDDEYSEVGVNMCRHEMMSMHEHVTCVVYAKLGLSNTRVITCTSIELRYLINSGSNGCVENGMKNDHRTVNKRRAFIVILPLGINHIIHALFDIVSLPLCPTVSTIVLHYKRVLSQAK